MAVFPVVQFNHLQILLPYCPPPLIFILEVNTEAILFISTNPTRPHQVDLQTENRHHGQRWLYTSASCSPNPAQGCTPTPTMCPAMAAIHYCLVKADLCHNLPISKVSSLRGPSGQFPVLPTAPYSLLCVAFHWYHCASRLWSNLGAAETIPKHRAARKSRGFMFQNPRKWGKMSLSSSILLRSHPAFF